MRHLVLLWILGLSWLGLGFFFLRGTYWALDLALWQTVLGYIMGGAVLIGGLAFTGLAVFVTFPMDHD